MAPVHGRKAYVSIEDSGDTERDISAYADTSSLATTIDASEVTTFGDDDREYIAGLAGRQFTVSGTWDATLDGYLRGIIQYDGPRDLIYGPAGNGSGKIKYTLPVILTSYNVDAGVGDADKWSATFQVTGAPTVGTFT